MSSQTSFRDCCAKKLPFEYKDGLNQTHGPFQIRAYHAVKDLLLPYKQRKLRKYHTVSMNNNNTFTSLYRWRPTPWRKPYGDCLWELKTYSSYSYTITRIKTFMRSMICVAISILCIFNFPAIFSWKYVYIQYITIIIVALICRYITNFHSKYINIQTDYTTKTLQSRYVLKLRLIYQNPGLVLEKSLAQNDHNICTMAMRLFIGMWYNLLIIIGSGNVLDIEAYKYWIYKLLYIPISDTHIIYKLFIIFIFFMAFCLNFFCLLLTPFLLFIVINNSLDPILNIRWVIPDRYDIQNDITYFLLKSLLQIKFIKKDKELQNALYHILNVVVAEVISKVTILTNEEEFCSKHNIKSCSEIKQEHLYCVEQYLTKRYCIYKEEEKYNDAICDCHIFDNQSMCLIDYKQFQQIHGFITHYDTNIDNINIRKIFGLICSLLFRKSKYLCPVIPIMISSYMVKWILFFNEYGYAFPEEYFKFDMCVFAGILLLLIILWIEPIYNYLVGYKTSIKDMIFWMNNDLLYYCNIRFTREIEERIIAYMVRLGLQCIEKYICVVMENECYYNEFMSNSYGLPMDVIQIIMDYLCEYECIDKLIISNRSLFTYRSGCDYNADDLKQEIVTFISNLTSGNKRIETGHVGIELSDDIGVYEKMSQVVQINNESETVSPLYITTQNDTNNVYNKKANDTLHLSLLSE